MIFPPTLTIAAIAAAVSGVAGFGLAWQLQAGNISELELTHANARIEAARTARATIDRAVQNSAKAQANAAARGVVNRTADAAAVNAGLGLRLKTADIVRTSTDNPAACSDTAIALGAVFDQCIGELTTLGQIADRHASDAQTLTESWPR